VTRAKGNCGPVALRPVQEPQGVPARTGWGGKASSKTEVLRRVPLAPRRRGGEGGEGRVRGVVRIGAPCAAAVFLARSANCTAGRLQLPPAQGGTQPRGSSKWRSSAARARERRRREWATACIIRILPSWRSASSWGIDRSGGRQSALRSCARARACGRACRMAIWRHGSAHVSCSSTAVRHAAHGAQEADRGRPELHVIRRRALLPLLCSSSGRSISAGYEGRGCSRAMWRRMS